MSAQTWRLEPLDADSFAVGEGPFRARGLAYVGALRYVDTRIPGARAAFLRALGADDPFAAFYDQIFLVTGDYDVSPLVRLYVVAAELEGVAVGRFIQERARWSGGSDTKGVWKPVLHGPSPAEVAQRLNFAFERYFPPCGATVIASQAQRFEGELRGLPSCMDGLYVHCTMGFYAGALQGAGARDVLVRFEQPAPDGARAGVAVERIRFAVQWSNPAGA
jgi:hypothetical protein